MLALAGCGAPGSDPAIPAPAGSPEPLRFDLHAEECSNAILFRFIDFEAASEWLPPGFHPRDAMHFVGSPVATNQGAAVLAVTRCATTSTGAPFEVAFAAGFVEPVEVPDVLPASLEFYEIERLGPSDAVSEALAGWGWPVVPAELAVASPVGPGAIDAEVSDALGPLYRFEGVVAPDFPVQFPGVRLWHAAATGLGYAQYEMPIEPSFGPGVCSLREGSRFARLTSTTDCTDGAGQIATYGGLSFDFQVRTFPGV